MQQQQSAWSTLVGLVVLGAIAYTIYSALKAVLSSITTLEPSVEAALVAAFSTILVTIISVLISKFLERKQRVSQEIRDRKIPVYESLIDFLFRVVKYGNTAEKIPDEEIQKFLFELTPKIIVWGSDDVIRALFNFRNNAAESGEALLRVGELLLAIRKDLGHGNQNLPATQVLGLFVNDVEENTIQSLSP
jgi:hypothetical protein